MPKSERWAQALRLGLERLFFTVGWEPGRGWQGYECTARCGAILVAWGGEAQQGTVHVEVPGTVCGVVADWGPVVAWLSSLSARLTRIDIAGDDFHGAVVGIDWAIDRYKAGEFAARGTPPSAKFIDDLGSGRGRTLYVGRRENGKLLRVYEKGRQLGASESKWVRAEVEWRSKDRVLPLDMLLRPAEFLAGAYGPLSFFACVVDRVRTFKERAKISYARVVEIARQHAGRAINAMLMVSQGDIGSVVALLRRDGFPSRLDAAETASLCVT
jgi:phage replication initiation protein